MTELDHLQIAKQFVCTGQNSMATAHALIAIAERLTPKPLETDAYNPIHAATGADHHTYTNEQM